MVDTKMIFGRLQKALGYSYETARSLYGTYFNSQTLYNLPSSFAVPMVTSAIPAIAAYVAQKKNRDAAQVLGASLKLMNLLAMPMAVGMGVLAAPIMGGLYGDTNPAAGSILSILSAAGWGVCIMMVTNAILQAYGHERLPILSIAVGGVCKVAVSYVLLGIPSVGILGAPLGNLVCYGVICVLNLAFIRRKAPDCPPLLPLFIRPLLASLLMGGCAWGVHALMRIAFARLGLFQSGRLEFLAPAAAAIAVGVVLYLVFVVALRAITKEELELVPKGDRLGRLLRVR
jgi:stage V sporulation protein B